MTELEAPYVALSYMGLRRRVKFSRPWVIAEKFLPTQDIFLDSGAHTVNRDAEKYSQRELMDIADHYRQFVADNLDRLTLVSEFDALPLGRTWIEQDREDFYNDLPSEKFMPIWHPEWGLDVLNEMADRYQNIGITSTSMGGRNLVPVLNQIAGNGVYLHGVGLTSIDEMYAIRWHSVSSTSWVSPQQYGDTIVWTGRELKRYPKKYKEQARKRYRTMFEREGFDSEKIEADDSTELLRLSIWSWQQLMDDIDKKRPVHLSVVTNPGDEVSDGFAEVDGVAVVTPPEETRKSLATVNRREPKPLPVLGLNTSIETVTNDDGTTEEIETTQFGIRSDSTRLCANCFLASKCPAFDENSNCAFNIPVEIKTRDQFQQVQNSLIEMQTQRVMFMRFAEETEGGYADPNLSKEMDRLQKMLKTKHEMEEEGFSLKIDMQAKGGGGQPGMLARLFGDQASEKARALPEPVQADEFIDGVVEGEWQE